MEYTKVKYISSATTTSVASTGNVAVYTVVIPKTTTGTITFQSTAGSPVTYFVFPASTVAGSYLVNTQCGNGLDIVTSAADTAIITYQTV